MLKKETILQEANALRSNLITWRRDLHQIPEIGMELPNTMAYLAQQLEAMEIPFTHHPAISCIEATVGNGSPCVLLRADADGLPMEEQAKLSFAAKNGCMHSCGHDLHSAMLLGAAKLLKMREDSLQGTVKLLFQSGEEIFQGAEAAIRAGILERPKVDVALALHVLAMLPLGMVMTGKRPMAAVDGFQIALRGKGGHGSTPEHCMDPINGAVQVYLALQSLMAREVGGTEEAVLTIGQFQSGTAPNTIPSQAQLSGTLRTFRAEVRERLLHRIREISTSVAHAYRCRCTYQALHHCPGVITDDAVTAQAVNSLQALDRKLHLRQDMHGMGSEDFAWIAQHVPASYLLLGAGPEDSNLRFGQHDSRVIFSEDVLPMGAAIYAQFAIDFLLRGKNIAKIGKSVDKSIPEAYDREDG